jgi:hypothetical protein
MSACATWPSSQQGLARLLVEWTGPPSRRLEHHGIEVSGGEYGHNFVRGLFEFRRKKSVGFS